MKKHFANNGYKKTARLQMIKSTVAKVVQNYKMKMLEVYKSNQVDHASWHHGLFILAGDKNNLFISDCIQWVWRCHGEVHKKKCLVLSVKYDEGNVMVWDYISCNDIGELHFIDRIMNAQSYYNILKEKILPSLKHLVEELYFQDDSDPKYSARRRE